jgi:hypothetical protein
MPDDQAMNNEESAESQRMVTEKLKAPKAHEGELRSTAIAPTSPGTVKIRPRL